MELTQEQWDMMVKDTATIKERLNTICTLMKGNGGKGIIVRIESLENDLERRRGAIYIWDFLRSLLTFFFGSGIVWLLIRYLQ